MGPWWLAAVVLAASGCASCLNPVALPTADQASQCAALPEACRNHVYVFLIDGPDPFDLANLGGVRQALISLGYIKTYCGQCWHAGYFQKEICRIHQEDESARFVVMGFSLGANAARDVAAGVQAEDVTIDLLVYCGGVGLGDDPKNRPGNATCVVNIVGGGADALAPALDGVNNMQLSDTSHFGSPTHASTLEMLVRQLTVIASLAPVVDLRPTAEPSDSPSAVERLNQPHDEWDFLQPTPPMPPPAP